MPKAAPAANRPRLELIDGTLRLSGDLTFATVTALLEESRGMFAVEDKVLCMDLSGVSRADSAGLALLIEWLREARKAGRSLEFHAVPAQMLAIAAAGGLSDILSLHPA